MIPKNVINILILIILVVILVRVFRPKKHPLRLVHYALYSYMKDFHDLCERHNLTYWADSGTLLGAVRENGIIPHDDDIDVCMFENDLRKLMEIVNHSGMYHMYHMYLLDHQPIYKFEHKDIPEIFIDIFVVGAEKDKIFYTEQKNRNTWPNFYYHESELYPLQQVPFGDMKIYIPNTPIPFIERAYGKNWQTPIDYGRH